MKILLIHQYFLPQEGSGGSRFNEMCKVWASMGHEITVLSGMVYHNSGQKYPKYRGKYFVREKYSKGVEVIRCHDHEGGQNSYFSRFLVYITFMFTSVIAGLFYGKRKYDIVLVSSPPIFVGISGVILSIIKRANLIFEVRDLWPESAVDTGVLRNKLLIKGALCCEKFIYNRAMLINVLTPAFAHKLKKDKGVNSSKIIEISNGSDFSLSNSILTNFDKNLQRRAYGYGKDDFIITYVGAHGTANGLSIVLDAAEQLLETNVCFLLVGDGMLKKQLIDDRNHRNLTNVKFLDPVSKREIFKIIAMSDMGASILTKNDTFKTVYSNKTFDYMSCSIPVLMLIDGVSRDLVVNADCGSYIEPENAREFSKVIRYHLNNQKDLNRLGSNGYNYAETYFDRHALAQNYIHEMTKSLN